MPPAYRHLLWLLEKQNLSVPMRRVRKNARYVTELIKDLWHAGSHRGKCQGHSLSTMLCTSRNSITKTTESTVKHKSSSVHSVFVLCMFTCGLKKTVSCLCSWFSTLDWNSSSTRPAGFLLPFAAFLGPCTQPGIPPRMNKFLSNKWSLCRWVYVCSCLGEVVSKGYLK